MALPRRNSETAGSPEQAQIPASAVYAARTESANTCSIPCATSEVFDCGGGLRRAGLTPRTVARFASKIQRSDGCWLWTAGTFKNGYGQFNAGRFRDGRQDTRYAHRVAYQLANGQIPDGLVVRHLCDTPRCCRPSHLLLGTQADNLQDARDRGRLIESCERPSTWVVKPAIRRRVIAEALTGPRGTLARICREHGLPFYALAVAVHRARRRIA